MENPNPNPNPSPAPFFVQPDGSYVEKFWEHPSFPESLKANEQIRTHKTLSDTLANWESLHRLNGFDKIPVPAPNSDPEVWNTVWDRLGRPKLATEYKLPAMDDKLPADRRAKPEFVSKVLQLFHKGGLTQRQVDTLLPGWNELVTSEAQASQVAQQQVAEESFKPLKGRWGNQFDANKTLVEQFVTATVAPEVQESLKAKIGSDPLLLEHYHSLALRMKESEPDTTTPLPADVKSQATGEIEKLTRDPAYLDAHHVNHTVVIKRVNELRTLLFNDANRGKK